MSAREGNVVVCRTLESLGVRTAFGVPGTQTVGLFEALRRSGIRTVLATHELGAAFMANGYARASGRAALLATIPGPGFAYTVAGLAEARADSAAVLHVTVLPAASPQRRFLLQHIDQGAIAGPVTKAVLDVNRSEQIESAIREAHTLAHAGEPGPVLVQIAAQALAGTAPEVPTHAVPAPRAADPALLDRVVRRLALASRPLLYVGQGAADAAEDLRRLVERRSIPVMTTPSGRGVIPEDHPLALAFEPLRGDVAEANALLAAADLVLAVGCKLTHNGTVGFTLRLSADRLVHVNTDGDALAGRYPASLAVLASAQELFAHLLASPDLPVTGTSAWTAPDVERWRRRLQVPGPDQLPEPAPAGPGRTAAALFASLRRSLPRHGILVTDSGLHQVMARRHFEVLAPRGLILPSDFQSMGFGVPAAIGAKLAAPDRPVVAVVGDGGLLMAGMELVTAAREGVPLTVIVFNDGALNQIRVQQYREFGRAHAVDLRTPDLEALAAALSVGYARVGDDPDRALSDAIAASRPMLVEVEIRDSLGIRALRAGGLARQTARDLLGAAGTGWVKRLRGRHRGA